MANNESETDEKYQMKFVYDSDSGDFVITEESTVFIEWITSFIQSWLTSLPGWRSTQLDSFVIELGVDNKSYLASSSF